MHVGAQAIILSLDYSSIPNVFPKSPSDELWGVCFPSLFYNSGPRYAFEEFRREILARTYRGGCCWLINGSYKHGMAIITSVDYGEKKKVKTTVGKIVYWVEEELGALEKGRCSVMSWKLEDEKVEQLLIRGSHSWVCTVITCGLVKTEITAPPSL